MCCQQCPSASGCSRSLGPSDYCYRLAPKCATPGVTRVLAIVVRAIESSLIRRAGLTRKGGARGGVVTLIQRFGPFGRVLNANVHFHMVALDGVYTKDGETPLFHEVSAPSSTEMQRLLDAIVARVLRCLERDGLLVRDPEAAAIHCWGPPSDVTRPDVIQRIERPSHGHVARQGAPPEVSAGANSTTIH